MDNGVYMYWKNNIEFDEAKFQRRIDRCWDDDIELSMAVLPDVVGGGADSLTRSATWYHYRPIPKSWPWYLVVQDGMTPDMIDDYHFDGIVGVFLGGTDAFKSTAVFWRDYAKERGLKFHYGRCNTIRRIEAALQIGVDSLDTFALHPMKWPQPKVKHMKDLLTGDASPHPVLWEG
jgi:hypothetical protein